MSSVIGSEDEQLLGVTPEASPGEVTRAYRRLARQIHPDVTDDPAAAEQFRALTAAYQRLLADAPPPSSRSVPILVRRTQSAARPPLVAGPVHVQPPHPRPREADDD